MGTKEHWSKCAENIESLVKIDVNDLTQEIADLLQQDCNENDIGKLQKIECFHCERNDGNLVEYIEPPCLYITDKGKYDGDTYKRVD